MKLLALIIGNPGEHDEPAYYCGGVLRDLAFYPEYFRSPLGGAWKESEVTVLSRPTLQTTRDALQTLKHADYSVAIFTGHGHTDPTRRSTILSLRRGHQIDSLELRRGAPKHTLILDCCREVSTPRIATVTESREALMAKAALDPMKCRYYFERALQQCAPGLVVLHACSIGEVAGDDPTAGGYYSSSILSESREWSKSDRFELGYCYPLSVADVHERAIPRVNDLSGGRQHPQIEKPRTERHFPFGIVV